MHKYINLEKASKALMLNEIGSNLKVAIKLSWAGNSNSGISFGYQQIDTKHNSKGYELLKKFNCTQEEIQSIKNFNNNPNNRSWNDFIKTLNYKKINEKLEKNDEELKKIFNSSVENYFIYLKKLGIFNLNFKDEESLIHLMDYHNQFDLSENGKMHKWLQNQKEITPEMIKEFKLKQTKWGTSSNGQNDIKRRFENIKSIKDYIVVSSNNLFKF